MNLRALRTLTISQNSIYDLESDCLHGLVNIRKLNLSGNSIETIHDNLFDGFSGIGLQEIDFTNNHIAVIQSNSFKNLKYLVFLDLTGNILKDIDEHTFLGMTSLRRLQLCNNKIVNIYPQAFSSLANLDSLDLGGNSLESLSGEVFGTSSSTPKKLRKLFLKNNNLSTIHPHTFDSLPNLDFLVFTDNKIVELDETLFLPLHKLKKFHINRNKVKELSGSLFNTTKLLKELYIDHNKLTFFPDVSNDFRNLLKISLHGNPWQCTCFKEIMDWVTRYDINYGHYDGSRPICVETNVNDCVKNVDFAKEQHIVAIYENA